MEWTTTNLAIQTVTGLIGAHVAAGVAHEHRFGLIGHSLVGLGAGALSGYFFQVLAMTTIYGAGDAMPATNVDIAVVQALTGAVVGGIAMMVIGFVRYEMAKSSKVGQ